jgi:hypothetical protein
VNEAITACKRVTQSLDICRELPITQTANELPKRRTGGGKKEKMKSSWMARLGRYTELLDLGLGVSSRIDDTTE